MAISVLVAGDIAFREAFAAALGREYTLVETESVTSAADALLASKPAVALGVLGGEWPAGSVICRRIRGAASTRLLPVVAFAEPGEDRTVAALDDGADHVLPFPPPRAELHARIRSALRNRLATERLEDASQVIFALANAVEAKDAYTEGHTERVGALAVQAGRLAGVGGGGGPAARRGGGAHNIGKDRIPHERINQASRVAGKKGVVVEEEPSIG